MRRPPSAGHEDDPSLESGTRERRGVAGSVVGSETHPSEQGRSCRCGRANVCQVSLLWLPLFAALLGGVAGTLLARDRGRTRRNGMIVGTLLGLLLGFYGAMAVIIFRIDLSPLPFR